MTAIATSSKKLIAVNHNEFIIFHSWATLFSSVHGIGDRTFCDGGKDYSAYPDVAKLKQVVKACDGLVLATPEYHGSLSGVMKNPSIC